MGMEKFFDIVCRFGDLTPSAVVLVTTVRAIKHHGGVEDDPRVDRAHALRAIEAGMANVRRHLGIIARVRDAGGRRRQPPPGRHQRGGRARQAARARGRRVRAPRPTRASPRGGAGAADLADAVVEACEQPNDFQPLYEDDEPIQDKIEAVAKRVYGAADVVLLPRGREEADRSTRADGLEHFPVCMAKTHLSLSADPTLLNAPEDFTLPVRDIRAYTGAGWLVPLCGDITQMPGPRQDAGRAQRRHRRGRADGRPVLADLDRLRDGGRVALVVGDGEGDVLRAGARVLVQRV